MELAALLPKVEDIARQSGALIHEIYKGGRFEHKIKEDNTPVTSADYAAHELIYQALKQLTPNIPILSEEDEAIAYEERTAWSQYWLIDPLDGTQEFVAASGDFASSIALVKNNHPVLGVIYAPEHNLLYSAAEGLGAFKQQNGVRSPIQIKKRSAESKKLKVAVSRVQKKEWVSQLLSSELELNMISLGSSTLKSCLVAEGKADCYLRIGPTGEWDTAAAQCILEQAGGQIKDLKLQALSYNINESLENPNFIAIGDPELNWQHILK